MYQECPVCREGLRPADQQRPMLGGDAWITCRRCGNNIYHAERWPQSTNARPNLSPLRTPVDHAERHRPVVTDAELEELRRGAQGF